jgi:hypothetical protein
MRFAAALASLLATGCATAQENWTTAAGPGPGAGITAARYEQDLDVYPHRIMGAIREKAVLAARDASGRTYRIDLRDQGPSHNVFEDIAPRVVDADGDGQNDIVVVETSQTQGAQLAIYSLRRGTLVKAHATPHIGTRFRWLAPVAIADLDGDGITDIAYIDRPHLAKTLQVWTFAPGGLTKTATLTGVTNHRIGDEHIYGALRTCTGAPELIVLSADWTNIVAVTYKNKKLTKRTIGPNTGPAALTVALTCG